MNITERLRPEVGAAGFAHDDTTVMFYERVNALIKPHYRVLDLGAGRGEAFDVDESYSVGLRRLKGRVAHVAGVDVDPVVLANPSLDEAKVIGSDGKLPFADAQFDLIFSDWVIEHIENVQLFVSEVGRVLKPGGWFCARTPNKWGYIALAARLTPASFESAVLRRVQPNRQEKDVFPKHYKFNTLSQIRSAFSADRWQNCSYSVNSVPAYHANSVVLFSAIDLFQKLTPNGMRTVLMVFVRKRPEPAIN